MSFLPACRPIMNSAAPLMALNLPGSKSTRPLPPTAPGPGASTDTNGHGTFLAGIAAGGSLPEQDFTGAAPECEIIVVKLKQAKRYLREFYLVSQDADAYQENDIMMGIKYLRVTAFRLGRPLIIS